MCEKSKTQKVSIFSGIWDQSSSFLDAQAAPVLEPTTCRIGCHHTSFTCFHWTTPLPPPLSVRPRLPVSSYKSRSALPSLLWQKHFNCSFCPRVSCRQSEGWPFGPPSLLWLPPDSSITSTLHKHLSFSSVFAAGLCCVWNSKLNELAFI